MGRRQDNRPVPRWLMHLAPHEFYASLLDVDTAGLAARGIQGLILDLDNTLAPWRTGEPARELAAWIDEALGRGLKCHIVSNDHGPRVRLFTRLLGIGGTAKALKPAGRAFRLAMAIMGTSPGRTAVIGDQLFTDVLGGRLQGCHTILVAPLSEHELGWTTVMRRLERAVLKRLQDAGVLPLEPRRRGDGR
ncbi:MAG: YqeG family HAD IIIA-type phosphatase [bacterium]|nr:YqeG family HAD IIIA-type phosphatase [bacterium]